MAAKPKAVPSPLEIMREAVSQMTADDLVEFGLDFYEELADRANVYADAIDESPREAIVEGYAYAKVAHTLVSGSWTGRAWRARRSLNEAAKELEDALYKTRSRADA